MTLRAKTLCIIVITLLGMLGVLFLVNRAIVLESLAEVEASLIRDQVVRATGIFERIEPAMERLADEYAASDETAAFIATGAGAFIDANLDDDTFVDVGVNVVVILDARRNVLFSKSYDLDQQVEQSVPEVFRTRRHPAIEPLLTPGEGGRNGVLVVGDEAWVVALRPVAPRSGDGRAVGTLIMARSLDRRMLRKIAELTGLRVDCIPKARLDAEQTALVTRLEHDPEPIIRPVDEELISGYGLKRDLHANAGLLVRVDADRDLWGEGRRAFVYFSASLVAGGVMFGLVMVVLLERVVLRRISDLGREVRKVGRIGDPSLRLAIQGRDEIGRLAGAINETFVALESSRGALQYIGKHARCILWSGTLRASGDDYVFEQKMQDENVAQRILPLDVFREGSYAPAWQRSIHPEDREHWEAAPADAVRSGQKTYRQEFRVRGKDLEDHWILEEVDIEPVNDDAWRLVGVCTDVTSHRRAAAELRRARDAALEISRMKSDFLANMSHEIRTPMNGIVGMTELLRGTELDVEQREYLDLIGSSADSLLRVINDVLDFSKLESGNFELDREPFDVRDGFGDTLALLAVRAQRKGIELLCDIEPDVPRRLVGDAVRLRQILVNLVGNAIKFTDGGHILVRVAVEPENERQAYLCVEVIDTGIGIPTDKQRSIFRPFAQADSSTTRKYGGTGLGLAISVQLAQQMHGRLWLESTPDVGSTFTFTALMEYAGVGPPEPDEALRGRRALLIDDHPELRRVLAKLLVANGLEADAVDPDEITDAGITSAPDVLIVEAAAPTRGLELIRAARDRGESMGAIALVTATERTALLADCRNLGAVSLLKPVREHELVDALRRSLGLAADATEHRPAAAMPATAGGPLRVLLAEDQAVNQQVATRLLERAGHEVIVVGNGREALQRWRDDAFDLILMDIQMPEMSGLAATERIRAEEQRDDRTRIPIIAMTAHALHGDRERCLAAGMDGYVSKPVRARALLGEIERLRPEHALGPGPSAAAPSFDRARTRAVFGDDDALLAEISQLFVASAPKQLDEARQALESGDLPAVARTAHAIKGAISNFGAEPVVALAVAVESAANAGDEDATRAAFEELDAGVTSFVSSLERGG